MGIYKQNFSIPMGSPLSPILADLVMRSLETRALETLDFQPLFYFRYVGDIIMAVPKNLVNFTLETFNSLHNKLKFTLEFSDDKINILDITVINNNLIEFDWYHKPTYSERTLIFYRHIHSHKKEA